MLTVLYLFSYSQSHIEVRDNKKVAVIDSIDIAKANIKLIELQQCKEERDSSFSQTIRYKGLVNNQKSTIEDLKKVIASDVTLKDDKDKIIVLKTNQVDKAGKKIKFLKVQRFTLIAIIATLTAKIIFFK